MVMKVSASTERQELSVQGPDGQRLAVDYYIDGYGNLCLSVNSDGSIGRVAVWVQSDLVLGGFDYEGA